MIRDPITLINDVVLQYLNAHAKLKIGKINAISGSYATVEFFENTLVDGELQSTPILQEVPLVHTLFSHNNNAGVIVPYHIGDNVLVAILDNLNKADFFTNNNEFQNLFTHNLANAIVIGKINTQQQQARTTEGVLIYKDSSAVEVLTGGIKISKDGETLQKTLEDLTLALKGVTDALTQSTVTVGVPIPLDNASVFTALSTNIATIGVRLNNLLQ